MIRRFMVVRYAVTLKLNISPSFLGPSWGKDLLNSQLMPFYTKSKIIEKMTRMLLNMLRVMQIVGITKLTQMTTWRAKRTPFVVRKQQLWKNVKLVMSEMPLKLNFKNVHRNVENGTSLCSFIIIVSELGRIKW